MIKAVIFDLDNTLLDFMKMKENSISAAVDAMIEAGLDIEKEKAIQRINKIYEEKGYEYQQVFDEFLNENLGYVDYKILAAGIVAYRKAKEAALILYPRVNMTLMRLAKMGLKLAVVSDAPSREAWLRLCHLNLHHIFDEVVTFDDTGKLKPSPDPFVKVLDRLNVKPEESLMVGDWPERDMVGAAKVGIKTVFARYGDTFSTVDSGADYEIDDFSQLIGIIEKENRER